MKAPKPPPSPQHPLVGRGVHICNEFGRANYQGEIVAVFPSGTDVGELVLIEWFEWLAGSATHQSLVPLRSLLVDPRDHQHVKLFENMEHANNYWDIWGQYKKASDDDSTAGEDE